ncbi:MAG TPA: hypothetical protein VNG13_08345 [Mycobacteriales bacterium]|nr:hypothetical protein [Mycobacteriales bacterium]
MNQLEMPSDILTPVIARATDFGEAALLLIDALRSEEATGAAMPESSVVRLHFVAASTYRSGLLCLWMPETSLASYGLIRGLLEVWAHLSFIADDREGGDARCRALRYERGALKEWADTAPRAPKYYDIASWTARHADKVRDIDSRWQECGCQGTARTRRPVKATLASILGSPSSG